jgi:DNA invertase Pin-like site-specific DNA recombinase
MTSAKNAAKNIISVTIDHPYWQQYVQRVNKFTPAMAGMAEQGKIKVVIYARVSTEEQVDGYSLDEQERICREYATSQGWEVLEVIRDEGFSGKNDRRRGYQKLMRLTARGRVNGVVTHKIDRAYRNLHGMMNTFNTWQEQNVFFASVTERIDFTTTWGKLILAVLSMLAEIFVDNLRSETIKGKRGRFMKGQHNGPAPFGYCRGRCAECDDDNGPGYCYRVGLPNLHHDKRLVPHPIDSLAVQHAFTQYNRGLYTDKQIAEQLNRFTVTTPTGERVPVRSRGKMGQPPGPFTKDMVRDLLQNPFYTGKVPYYGSEIAGQRVKKFLKPQDINHGLHLPLITEADHNQAMDIRALKGRAPQGNGFVVPPTSMCCKAWWNARSVAGKCTARWAAARRPGCSDPPAFSERGCVTSARSNRRCWRPNWPGKLLASSCPTTGRRMSSATCSMRRGYPVCWPAGERWMTILSRSSFCTRPRRSVASITAGSGRPTSTKAGRSIRPAAPTSIWSWHASCWTILVACGGD